MHWLLLNVLIGLFLLAPSVATAQDCVDEDLDGFCGDVDCDDTAPEIYPGATEIPGNEIDEDCDGFELCYENLDGDLYGSANLVESLDLDCHDAGESRFTGDCDDTDDRVYPGATEVVANGVDENCDGGEICYQDLDADGFGAGILVSADADCTDADEAAASGDCDDGNPLVYPGAPEDPENGIDDDCDGAADPVRGSGTSWGTLKARY
jgi:hypothetical protein